MESGLKSALARVKISGIAAKTRETPASSAASQVSESCHPERNDSDTFTRQNSSSSSSDSASSSDDRFKTPYEIASKKIRRMNVQQLQSQDLATYPGGIIRNYEEDLGRYSEKHLIQKIKRKERKNQDATTQKAELAEVPKKRAILQKEISRRDNKLQQERLQKLDNLFTQHGKDPETIVRILDPNRHRSLGYSTIRLKQYLRNVNSQLLQKRLTTPWKKTEIAELRDRQAFLETYLKENRNVDV